MDHQVHAQLQALLLEPILQPLTSAFGEYGEIAVEQFAQALAQELSS